MKKELDLPMPAGWFQVMYSADIGVGESKPLHFFDSDLVIFRGESGVVGVLDAYCPHMGAHLGYGIRDNAHHGSSVDGDSIVCPFHHWQYNSEGKCTGIPYAKNMPPKVARGEQVIKSWPTRELNQCIYVWFHPEEIEPTYDVWEVPEAQAENADWSDFHLRSWELPTHMQEIGENSVDAAHFKYVHGTVDVPETAYNEFNGHERSGKFVTRHETPRGVVEGGIETANLGPGLTTNRFTGFCEILLMANLTPVNGTETKAFYSFILREGQGEAMERVGQAYIDNICQQMEEDSIIWRNKTFLGKPMLCDGDGPFAKFRKWYAQFLVEPSGV